MIRRTKLTFDAQRWKAEKALAHELSDRETRIMEAKLKRALVRLKVHG